MEAYFVRFFMGYFPFCFNQRNFWKNFHGHNLCVHISSSLILVSLDWWRRVIGWCYCGALLKIVFYSLYTWQKVKMFSLWDQTKGKVDPVDPKEKGTWILGSSRSVDDPVSIKPLFCYQCKIVNFPSVGSLSTTSLFRIFFSSMTNWNFHYWFLSFFYHTSCFMIFVMELDILIILYSAMLSDHGEILTIAQNKRDIKGEKEKHRT